VNAENYAPGICETYAPRICETYAAGICRTEQNRTEQRTNEESFVPFKRKLTFSNAHEEPHRIARSWPEVGERWPVIRTERTHSRQQIPRSDRLFVYARDGFMCQLCGRGRQDWERDPADLVLDHVVPWSAGGSDHVNNLRTLCWQCNEDRSNVRLEADASWSPLPVTYECVRCDPDLPRDEPDIGLSFCYHHRTRALGVIDTRQLEVAGCRLCDERGYVWRGSGGGYLCSHELEAADA